jgi:NADH-quinone oxidoreductase subunit N
MTFTDLWTQCGAIAPELAITATICVIILADMLIRFEKSRAVCSSIALAGVVIALAIVFIRINSGTPDSRHLSFGTMFRQDQTTAFFRIVLLLSAAGAIAFSMRSRETEQYRQGEYYSLMLGAILGGMFLAASDNFILFFLGFETLSICCYVLAASIKHDRFSAEAGLKYVIYGAITSGVMLFGISYIYGISGSLTISRAMGAIATQGAEGQLPPLALFLVLTFTLAGVGFKIAMVPFHFWCPDVYQGSPTPVTAFLAVASKSAGFAALLRLLLPFFATAKPTIVFHGDSLALIYLPVFFGILAMVTMTFGNLVALRQTNVKRLLAYSSIAHAGYLLMGFTAFERASYESVFFYLFVYLFMNLGAFWVVILFVDRVGGAEISRFRGAAVKAPFLFVAMFIFLISLTGLPPTAGFVGKFMLFKVVVGAGLSQMTVNGGLTPMASFYFFVATIGVLNSAVSLYYYMTIIRAMAFEKSDDERPLGLSTIDNVITAALVIPTVGLLHFAPVLRLIEMAAR